MINKVLENQNLLKLLFSFSILLIFLDSYQVLNTPLSWVGNLLLTLICLIIFRKEKMKFNLLFFIIVFVTLLPTIFSLFTMTYNFVNLNYLGIRLFSYLGFILVFFVIINFGYKEAIVESLKIIFYLISIMSIYFFIAQIFNIPEPIRNRPGTGILGFDIQTTFWSSGSHRMLGTFREPVFLVSLLFPSFIVLHYKTKNNFLFYLLSGIIFGLTKSELSLLLIFAITIVDIFLKNFQLKNLIFFISYFLFFILPIQECDISPSNIECPNEDLSGTIEEIVELDIAKVSNDLSDVENDIQNSWRDTPDRKSWSGHQIRSMLISKANVKIRANLEYIRVAIVLAPLLGLLGTILGMIEVFHILAVTGGGDAKAMAGGVAKSTIPAMAGLMAAIPATFASRILEEKAKKQSDLLQEHLTFE